MKRLRRRLFLHFSFQFISLAIAIIILFFFVIFISIIWVTKDESKYNYYETKIESISMNTGNSINEITMLDGWDEGLDEEGLWVQIIDYKGKVIESSNVPDKIPTQYSQHELYQMRETNELLGYTLFFYLETLYEHPYLFVLGYEDEARQLLQQITAEYGKVGKVPNENLKQIEDKLLSINGLLRIFDEDENLVQSFGNNLKLEEEQPLDIFVRERAPDTYSTKTTVIKDPQTETLWVLYTPNENKKEIRLDSLKEIIIAFAASGVIVLIITIIISFWNGFRYGNPLFIFTSWLSRMGRGNYEEVLTEKEKKLIFRKNGKVRFKYRLYAEVFHAFYGMAEQLAASTKEREQLERTREEWMTGISHDLRTPLTTIQGYGTLLESGQYEWSKQELEDIGKIIGEKSAYMLSLIEDFSLSFRLKNEASHVDFHLTEMNQFLNSVVSKFIEDITLADYQFSFTQLNHKLPLPIAKRWFERMIDNLIYNAILHNPPGTAIRVFIEEDLNKWQLKIMIRDNGNGMDDETQKHLFNRYYRGTNTDERIEGTGLGMSIAMQIAQLHKGEIIVDSEINKGTTVSICIPFPQDDRLSE